MRHPKVYIKPIDHLPQGKALYRVQDFALIYDILRDTPSSSKPTSFEHAINHTLSIPPSQDILIISDTLTLIFDGTELCLKGLDAYTNQELWKDSSKPLPSVSQNGILCVDPISLSIGPVDVDTALHYEVSHTQNWVRICCSDGESADLVQVGTNLIVGLYKEMISDIYLLNIKYE